MIASHPRHVHTWLLVPEELHLSEARCKQQSYLFARPLAVVGVFVAKNSRERERQRERERAVQGASAATAVERGGSDPQDMPPAAIGNCMRKQLFLLLNGSPTRVTMQPC